MPKEASMKRVILSITDLSVKRETEYGHKGGGFYSTGVLEKALEEGCEVYIVTTRERLEPSYGWWMKLVKRENIFLGDRRDNEVGLRALLDSLEIPWPSFGKTQGLDREMVSEKDTFRGLHDYQTFWDKPAPRAETRSWLREHKFIFRIDIWDMMRARS
jgi:hypothetical protein